jgi:antitoxin component YwqK of YwqJK toxin-antitoxin module
MGLQRTWFAGGGPKTEQTYVAGVLEGAVKTWHPNGLAASQGTMKNGLREGEWSQWGEDGGLLEAWSGLYEAGQRVSRGDG